MISESQITEVVSRLVHAAHPTKVILFGSYARGEPKQDSDLDILVIEPHVEDKVTEMARLRNSIGDVGVGVDVLVCSEAEAASRKDWSTTLVYWALKEGKVLYSQPE